MGNIWIRKIKNIKNRQAISKREMGKPGVRITGANAWEYQYCLKLEELKWPVKMKGGNRKETRAVDER